MLLPVSMQAQKNTAFIPGQVWNDTDGNPINAHGGGLLYHNGTYYWYGEFKKGKTILPDWATWECYRTDVTGVGCYSSKDLLNWKFEGIVLSAVKDDPNHDLHPSKVLERPKVIFNKKTGKFVMWAHVESADYSKACAGVAVADTAFGGGSAAVDEAIEALCALGYSNSEIMPALKQIPNYAELSSEVIIKQALKLFAGRK